MASSDNESPPPPPPPPATSAPPSLEELSRRGVRSLLLPYIISLISTPPPREVLVLLDSRTGSVSMVEGSGRIESFLRGKEGPLPASKASVEAMREVEVREEEGVECAICLVGFEEGEAVKEMPCMHKYHGRCIEKWLGIHGSCPICRYQMPVEEEEENNIKNESDVEDDGGAGFVFHIYVAASRRGESDSDPDTILDENEDGDHENSSSGLLSDMDIDSIN